MILNRDLIKKSEESAVLSGAFSFRQLMFAAGSSAAKIITDRFSVRDKKIAVICGNGNNGGDGFVIADCLYGSGADVTLITPIGPPATENAKYYYGKLKFVTKTDFFDENTDYNIIIDAIFGIGFNRKPDDEILKLFESINRHKAVKISVDIPSGVNCDNGNVYGCAIKADLTVTFIAPKPCFFLPDGSDFCGEVSLADIGVKPVDYSYRIIEKPIFEKRRHNSHKGTFGTALMLCGSYGMVGAAMLSAKAALRSGAGIAKCVLCEGIYPAFTTYLPEAVCVPVPQTSTGTFDSENIDIPALLHKSDAMLFGCGVGKGEDIQKILKNIIEFSNIPIVIDADGINALANCIDILKESKAHLILTPHPAEMARLCKISVKEVESNRVNIARDFTLKYGCVLVLKGADTIVAAPDGKIWFNPTGNPGMSSGGSGDVLAGIIVSLLAQGFSPIEAAKSAVYLHGEAGDKAAEIHGERQMLPSDIIEEL